MKIHLYYYPFTCAMVPYIALTEAGAEFEVLVLNLQKQEHRSPEFIKINPKHKVPVLIVDGERLTENVAIHLWVSRVFPDAGILPSEPWKQAQAVSMLTWFSSGIHPFLSRINIPVKVCDVHGTSDSVVRLALETLNECFAIADKLLAGREYFFDSFTAPDAHFFWCTRRSMQLKVDLSPYSNVISHFERIKVRPSVQKLLAFEKKTIEGFKMVA